MQSSISGDFIRLVSGSTLNRPALDLDKLRNNDDYIASLFHKRGISEEQNKGYQKIKTMAKDLIEIINSELEYEK
jgi:hypothetical protein